MEKVKVFVVFDAYNNVVKVFREEADCIGYCEMNNLEYEAYELF